MMKDIIIIKTIIKWIITKAKKNFIFQTQHKLMKKIYVMMVGKIILKINLKVSWLKIMYKNDNFNIFLKIKYVICKFLLYDSLYL